MEKVSQLYNIGVFIDNKDTEWKKITKERLNTNLEGFSEYFEGVDTEYSLILKDLEEVRDKKDYIVVPDNAKYYADGTFYSIELRLAYKIEEKSIIFWVTKEYDVTGYTPYLLNYLFEMQNSTFMHGAAISQNNSEGHLIIAFGGIGKTCFIANALKKDDVKLMGDDLIILSEDGTLRSYPRPFCLYPYHKSLFPQFFEGKKFHFEELRPDRYILRIQKKLKFILKIKDSIIYDFIPVSPIRLFHKEKFQKDPVKLKNAYVMRRKSDIDKLEITVATDVEKVANFTQNVILHEWSISVRPLNNLFAQRFESFGKYVDKQFQIILNCLLKAEKIYYIDIPEKMNAEMVSAELNKIIPISGDIYDNC